MSNNSNGFGNFVAGVLFGAAIGGISALLMAPDNGKRTRKKINRKLRYLNDNVEDILSRSLDSISHLQEDVENNISDLTKKSKKMISK